MVFPHLDWNCKSHALRQLQSTESIDAVWSNGTIDISKPKEFQLVCSLSIYILQGLGWEGPGFADDELALAREWLRSRGNSIEGGTSEIQLNIIAKNVLGLPD
jgi:alkylation response protein AidB-like acyl-CoA dehydrogenase